MARSDPAESLKPREACKEGISRRTPRFNWKTGNLGVRIKPGMRIRATGGAV